MGAGLVRRMKWQMGCSVWGPFVEGLSVIAVFQTGENSGGSIWMVEWG